MLLPVSEWEISKHNASDSMYLGSANFSCEESDTKSLVFVVYRVFVTAAQFCCCSGKAVIDNAQLNIPVLQYSFVYRHQNLNFLPFSHATDTILLIFSKYLKI